LAAAGASIRLVLAQVRFVDAAGKDLSLTPEPDPFTAEERSRLLAWFVMRTFRVPAEPGITGYVLRPHPAYHVYLHLLFWSGTRPSEAAGLQRRDIDLERAGARRCAARATCGPRGRGSLRRAPVPPVA